jgi:hypothetical protein
MFVLALRILMFRWDVADTLDAYIDKYSSLVFYLADNSTAGAVPPSDLVCSSQL